jgi:serine/threonine protein kinase
MSDKQSFDIFDHYSIQKILAKREFSSTYLASAKEQAVSQTVIKVFHRAHSRTSQTDEASKTYIKTLLSLQHPSIVPLFDVIFNETQLYVVRAYLSHDSLGQRLQSLPNGRLKWEETLNILLKVGHALSYAHNHAITHGNIKPENILYNDNDEVMLTDFSIIPAIHFSTFVYPSHLHTAHYMAPEQFMGQANPLSDQYALACLAYALISGHPPFESSKFTSLWDKHANEDPAPLSIQFPYLPQAFTIALMKALAKDPSQRYPDMATFLLALVSGSALSSVIQPIPIQNLQNAAYGVDINTSLSNETGSETDGDPQVDFPPLPPQSLPDEPVPSSSIPLQDPFNETMTMFVVGDTLAANEPTDLAQAHAIAQPMVPVPATLPFEHTTTIKIPFPIQKRAYQPAFLVALLLLAVMFTATCLALVLNHAATPSSKLTLHRPSTVTVATPPHSASLPPAQILSPSPKAVATPTATHAAQHDSQVPATSSAPAPAPTPQPAAQPTPQPTESPAYTPETPWWNGSYGSWQHRSPTFSPYSHYPWP